MDYFHQEKSIVHFDIKPGNVLVFQFPQCGHQCYTHGEPLKSLSCVHCSVHPGVLVKLADLGISAFVGPGGFHRKQGTPGHTAPEAIRHMGKEKMTEKVAKFNTVNPASQSFTIRLMYSHLAFHFMS